jgi:hypothetical protein
MQFVVEAYQFGGGYDQALTGAFVGVGAIYADSLSDYDPILVGITDQEPGRGMVEHLALHGRATIRFCQMILALVIGLGAVPLLEMKLAHARDHQRPDLSAWFQSRPPRRAWP